MLEHPWVRIEQRLRELYQTGDVGSPILSTVDADLEALGLTSNGDLTDRGVAYAMAAFVTHNETDANGVLGDLLKEIDEVRQFCGALWPQQTVPKAGAVILIRRLFGIDDDSRARRWLELINKAGLVRYNRSSDAVRILWNPDGLAVSEDSDRTTVLRTRIISPDTPYGNRLSLKRLLGESIGTIRWYEQHLPPKVLEVLYEEVTGDTVTEIRLLSGPANITKAGQKEYEAFKKEMLSKRSVTVEWRVLPSKEAFKLHDRFFISDALSVNLPPLNTILAGSKGEILESEVGAADFDEWWAKGEDLKRFEVEA